MRLFAARTAIDVHPKLILCTKEKLNRELRSSKVIGVTCVPPCEVCNVAFNVQNGADRSPGVFTLHAAHILDTNNVRNFVLRCIEGSFLY